MTDIMNNDRTDTTNPFEFLEKNRMVFLEGEITEENIKKTMNSIIKLKEASEEPIHLFVSGPGGEFHSAFWLIQEIETSEIPIITYCHTHIASASSFIFMAGHVRIVYPSASIMLHGITGGAYGEVDDVNAQVKLIHHMNKYLTKYTKEHTSLSEEEIKTIIDSNKEAYYFGQEAVEAGIADQLYNGSVIQPIYRQVPECFTYIPTLSELSKEKIEKRFDKDNTE